MIHEDITGLFSKIRRGEDGAGDELIGLVYQELHRIARHHMREPYAGNTLQPTALVNEAYIRLFNNKVPNLQDRKHFFVLAARAMRQVLIERARKRNSKKRGGDLVIMPLLDGDAPGGKHVDIDAMALEEALAKLDKVAPRQAQVLSLRLFVGLKLNEIAEIMGIAMITVRTDIQAGVACLREQLTI